MMPHRLRFGTVLGIGLLSSTAAAVVSKLEVTYTLPEVIFGPISGGLDALPEQVCLTVLISEPVTENCFDPNDVIWARLDFGDGSFTYLDAFSMCTDEALQVDSLDHEFLLVDTATMLDVMAQNFPLTIEGTDIASGQDFEYQYSNSTQTFTEIGCPGDCDGSNDGLVNILDFLAVLGTWGDVGVPCDFDGDGVGITDFLTVLGLWGECP